MCGTPLRCSHPCQLNCTDCRKLKTRHDKVRRNPPQPCTHFLFDPWAFSARRCATRTSSAAIAAISSATKLRHVRRATGRVLYDARTPSAPRSAASRATRALSSVTGSVSTSRCVRSVCERLCDDALPTQSCESLCAAPCTRLPCNKRCSKSLSCGHQCPGLCGEDCPPQNYCQVRRRHAACAITHSRERTGVR
jgi:hypothetical protein